MTELSSCTLPNLTIVLAAGEEKPEPRIVTSVPPTIEPLSGTSVPIEGKTPDKTVTVVSSVESLPAESMTVSDTVCTPTGSVNCASSPVPIIVEPALQIYSTTVSPIACVCERPPSTDITSDPACCREE